MLKINKITLGELNTNGYILYDDKTKDAVIIDPAESASVFLNFAKDNNLKIHCCLLTHGHYDHIGACYDLQKAGIPIYIHKLDAPKCKDNNLNLSNIFSPQSPIKIFEPNVLIHKDKTIFNFGSLKLIALHTPGHSEGSCSYAVHFYENDKINKPYVKHLFSGDAIFENGGFGRYDFYDGSRLKTIKTVKFLRGMVEDGYILHSGH